jgi:predicted RNA methylase
MSEAETAGEAFSSIDFVGQCLLDPEKAEAFEAAIKSVVKPESAVLDVGTGSGILALLSAAAGAKSVTALEFDPFVASIAEENFKNNGYADTIKIKIADARSATFEKGEHFDIVTMEMLSSGMVDEMQVQAINNLHRQGVVSSQTVFLPQRQDTYVSLAHIDFNLFGFKMKMILHAWKIFKNIKIKDLSGNMLLNSIDFRSTTEEYFENTIKIPITQSGTLNALWLYSRAWLTNSHYLENTISLNPPVAIPLPEIAVTKGDVVELKIAYTFGHGYQNFHVSIV